MRRLVLGMSVALWVGLASCGRLGYDPAATPMPDGSVEPTVEYAHIFEGSEPSRISGLGIDGDGNLYLAGSYDDDVRIAGDQTIPAIGPQNMLVASFNPTGELRWVHGYGGTMFVDARDLVVLPDGRSYTAGLMIKEASFQGIELDAGTGQDVLLAIHESDGKVRSVDAFTGIDGNAQGRGIAVDSRGDIVISGLYGGDVDFGAGFLGPAENERGFAVKLDSTVTHEWSRPYAGNGEIFGNGAAIAEDGTSCFVGRYNVTTDFGGGPSTPAGNDAYLACYDASGGFQWAQTVSSPLDDRGFSVAAVAGGGFVVAGFSSGEATFGGQTGSIAVPGHGGSDGFVARYSAAGAVEWVRVVGGDGNDYSAAVRVDGSGVIYLVGGFSGTGDFAGISLTSSGGDDGFVLALDSAGAALWAKSIGGAGDEAPRAVAARGGQVVVGGELLGETRLGDTTRSTATQSGFIYQLAAE